MDLSVTVPMGVGSVTFKNPVMSAAGTFGVVLELPNARHQLPGGIRCKLRLKSGL